MRFQWCDEVILRAIEKDSPFGDITIRLLGEGEKEARGVLFPRQRCTLFGVECARRAFELLGAEARIPDGVEEGMVVEKEQVVLEVAGRSEDVLLAERTALNLISHLSGIATATAELVRVARETNPGIIVAATRKVTPGLGLLEKMAVEAGGGSAHRFSLSDMVLIKDNHLALLGGGEGAVREAVKRIRAKDPFHKIEVEVGNLQEALAALEAGADIIMLDNFTPAEAERAYKEIKKRNGEILVEVSGGIRPENVAEYAPHADIISSGYITHSAPAVDFTLELL